MNGSSMSDRPPHPAPNAFSDPETVVRTLAPHAAVALLASVGDVTLVIDSAGVIRDMAVPNAELDAQGVRDWVGQPWRSVVTIESQPKVAEMLDDSSQPGRWRQVNHLVAGSEVPLRYLMMRSAADGSVIAIGREMRAAAALQQRLLQTQQSLERDYIKMRQAEARYRMLFDLGTEPILIVDAATRRIRESNPAALAVLGVKEGALADQPIATIVMPEDRESFIAHLGAASASDDLAPLAVRLADDQGDAQISVRLFRHGRAALLLVRIVAATPILAEAPHTLGTGVGAAIGSVIEHMPDAFVLTDAALTILVANAAFVELAGAASADRVIGASLGLWLGRPGIDLDLILAQIREHDAVRNVATILRSETGAQEEIELSGVAAPQDDSVCYGFTIRNVGRRLRSVVPTERDVPRSVEQLTELVGRMSLKDIVRESTDLIERLCIEAALAYTSDNRASAAEILGVSRQSLYSKLHRHGLGNLVSGDN